MGVSAWSSEQPRQELRRKESQSAAEHDARDLALRAALAEHEHEAADDDRHQGEGARQRSREGRCQIVRSALPGLREPVANSVKAPTLVCPVARCRSKSLRSSLLLLLGVRRRSSAMAEHEQNWE